MTVFSFVSWGGGIRTPASRYQKPLPYRLATPQGAIPDEIQYN